MKKSGSKLRYTYKEWEVFSIHQYTVFFAVCFLSDVANLVGLQKETELSTPVLSFSGLFTKVIMSQDKLLIVMLLHCAL